MMVSPTLALLPMDVSCACLKVVTLRESEGSIFLAIVRPSILRLADSRSLAEDLLNRRSLSLRTTQSHTPIITVGVDRRKVRGGVNCFWPLIASAYGEIASCMDYVVCSKEVPTINKHYRFAVKHYDDQSVRGTGQRFYPLSFSSHM